jgi:hypothetical protein
MARVRWSEVLTLTATLKKILHVKRLRRIEASVASSTTLWQLDDH